MEIDINIRKIDLAKRILNLKDEFLLENLELFLNKANSEQKIIPLTHKEYVARIEQSEKDFENEDFYTTEELLKELDL
ncbi:hypothetical protein SAMN05421847_2107 [Halpernia humi]|uniref:Uncharacterized protein n=1 Tax=Halpernia humi TaxID=493375 RepID=A0A1H5ZQM2_9FLAO|nr:hypothetical protein [Halpernia humi]SEG37696.1 hypothetical protein SAMN05421847_2107 [Halpernia humi]